MRQVNQIYDYQQVLYGRWHENPCLNISQMARLKCQSQRQNVTATLDTKPGKKQLRRRNVNHKNPTGGQWRSLSLERWASVKCHHSAQRLVRSTAARWRCNLAGAAGCWLSDGISWNADMRIRYLETVNHQRRTAVGFYSHQNTARCKVIVRHLACMLKAGFLKLYTELTGCKCWSLDVFKG